MKDNQASDQSKHINSLLASLLSLDKRYKTKLAKTIQLFSRARDLRKKTAFEGERSKEHLSEIKACLKAAVSDLNDSVQIIEEKEALITKLVEAIKEWGQGDIEIPSQYAEFYEPGYFKPIKKLNESLTKEMSLISAETELLTGKRLVKKGNWYRGLDVLRDALEEFRAFNDLDGMARAYIEIGKVQELFGDYEVAKLSFLDAERLFKKTKREEGIAVAELQLGTLALDYYDYEQARQHLKFASSFFHQNGDKKRAELSDGLLNLADEYERDLAMV